MNLEWPITRSMIISIRILAAIGGAAMASTGECEPIFLAVFVSFFLLGLKVEAFPRLANLLAKVQPFMAAAMFLVALVDFFFLSNSFLLSVAHFLLTIQGLRLLVLRTLRDNVGGILISSMMILSSSTLAVDWTFFVMLAAFVPVVIWSLILHTLLGEMKEPVEWKPLRKSVAKSSSAAFLTAAACCTFVFVVFPRFNFQGFRGQFLQPVHKAGFTNQVNLEKSGRIYEDHSILMRVEIDPADRSKWPGYIRGATLSSFDGKTWSRGPQTMDRIYRTGGGEILLPTYQNLTGERLKQSIYLESMDSPVLFTVPQAVRLRMNRPFLEHTLDGTLQRPNSDSWRVHYQVESIIVDYDKFFSKQRPSTRNSRRSLPLAKARNNMRINPFELERDIALELPKKSFQRISDLAGRWTGRAGTNLEKAYRLANNLRKHAEYTVDLGVLKKGEDPIERFLFETRKGHCEYFASSLCLMMRLSGIPARMVTGFTAHEWNQRGHYYVVRMKDAHAWVEAYIEPYGWVPFDASPRDMGPEQGLERGWNQAWDYLNLRWNRYILSYDLQQQVALFRSLTQSSGLVSLKMEMLYGNVLKRVEGWMAVFHLSSFDKPPSLRPILEMLSLILIAGSLIVFVVLVRRSRREKDKVWFYRRLVKALEKRGRHKPEAETLYEFSRTLPAAVLEKAEIQFLEDQYYRLRFDPAAKLSSDEAARIKTSLSRLK